LIIRPEEADVVTRRRERIGDAQRNTALARRWTVKAAGPEQLDEPGFLSAALACFVTPEPPERPHHALHLRQVRATSGARPHVLVATRTLGRGERALPVGRDELQEPPAWHARR
jgi:hypothetical protein